MWVSVLWGSLFLAAITAFPCYDFNTGRFGGCCSDIDQNKILQGWEPKPVLTPPAYLNALLSRYMSRCPMDYSFMMPPPRRTYVPVPVSINYIVKVYPDRNSSTLIGKSKFLKAVTSKESSKEKESAEEKEKETIPDPIDEYQSGESDESELAATEAPVVAETPVVVEAPRAHEAPVAVPAAPVASSGSVPSAAPSVPLSPIQPAAHFVPASPIPPAAHFVPASPITPELHFHPASPASSITPEAAAPVPTPVVSETPAAPVASSITPETLATTFASSTQILTSAHTPAVSVVSLAAVTPEGNTIPVVPVVPIAQVYSVQATPESVTPSPSVETTIVPEEASTAQETYPPAETVAEPIQETTNAAEVVNDKHDEVPTAENEVGDE